MSFRLRKRLKLFPGLWINLSKKGGSVSLGGHGATVNLSRRGLMGTASAPGTGVSYRSGPHRARRSSRRPMSHTTARRGFWSRLLFG